MPALSAKQRAWAFAELARRQAGKKTRSGMTESQLEDFTHMAPKKRKKKRYGY